MPFQFTEAQWSSLCGAMEKLGADPSSWIREQLEKDIEHIFTRDNSDNEMIKALRRVREAAYELSDALVSLAQINKSQIHRHEWLAEEIIANDVNARLRFAKQVRQYAEGADWTLDKGYGAYKEAARGRPSDTALLGWAASVLRVARQERWATEDHRGRTSAAFMDLVVELAGCAQAAGVTHGRDRRSLARAMAQAREEQRKDDLDAARIRAELDALGRP